MQMLVSGRIKACIAMGVWERPQTPEFVETHRFFSDPPNQGNGWRFPILLMWKVVTAAAF